MGKVIHIDNSGGGGVSGLWKYTAINYADLLTKTGMNEGDLAIVYNSQGVWLINRKLKGIYIYQSGVWEYANQELQSMLEMTEYKVKVSTNDTTGDYLSNKTENSLDLFQSISNPAANEKLNFGLFAYNKVWTTAAVPTSGDDDSVPKRHRIGQIWFSTTSGKLFIAKSILTGAAVWLPIPVNESLKTKSGVILAVAFSGTPKKTAAITFVTPFADANYSVVATAQTQSNASFVLSIESILAGSFIINTNTNNIAKLIDVRWIAIKHGEN